MSRFQPVDIENATGTTKELLDRVYADMGMIPNFVRIMALSPNVLDGFLKFRESLESGVLAPKLRRKIGLTVAETNHAEYCVSGHAMIAKSLGLSDDEITDARRGVSTNSKEEAALHFAREIVETRGNVSDDTWHRVRDVGFNDREILEIVGCVGLFTLGDYFTECCQPVLDFDRVPELAHV